MEEIDFDCNCEFKCECEGLGRDIPDTCHRASTCKYCYFTMKGNEEEAAEELVEEEKEKGENCEKCEEDVAVELGVGKLVENVEGGEEEEVKKCNCLKVAMRAYVNIKKMMDQSHHMTEEAAMHIVENYRKETEEYSSLKKTNKGLVDALFASALINFGFALMCAVKSSAILLVPVAWLWKNHMT